MLLKVAQNFKKYLICFRKTCVFCPSGHVVWKICMSKSNSKKNDSRILKDIKSRNILTPLHLFIFIKISIGALYVRFGKSGTWVEQKRSPSLVTSCSSCSKVKFLGNLKFLDFV